MSEVAPRAPLRWAGSKRKLLPLLQQYWSPTDKRYLEAFAGSAALFFELQPSSALLNDINEELVSALKCLKNDPIPLHLCLLKLPVSAEFFYGLRSVPVESLNELERAARFFYLNRYCFNGIYRTNKQGEFNVPFAPLRSGGFPSIEQWLQASKLLSKAKLQSLDFQSFLLKNVRKGDFVYLDPPYAVTNRRIFAQYSAQNFGVEDIRRLSSLLAEIDHRGATFVVSYAQSPETRLLSNDWFVRRTYAQRNVAGFTQHRRRAMEVLISNRRPTVA